MSQVLSRRPAVGVISLALVLAGIVVLLVIGVWASWLGDPPDWAFDCNDTTCTDLWAGARGRYLWVAALAGVTVLFGTALGGWAVPSREVAQREVAWGPVAGPDPAGRAIDRRARAALPGLLRLLALLLLVSATLWGAGWLALSLSRPFGLAVALLALLFASFATWRWIRPGALNDRVAYWMAGLGIMAPVLVLGTLANHPIILFALVLLLVYPLLGVPTLTIALLVGAACMKRLIEKTENPAPMDGPAPVHLPATAEPGEHSAEEAVAEPSRSRPSHRVTAAALVSITVLAVVAAWPVPAHPADAWKYLSTSSLDLDAAEPEDPAPRETPRTTSPTYAAKDPAPTPVPTVEAAGLPQCTADAVQITANGWDGITGNSVATLRATNVGSTSCAMHGTPQLALSQGGEEIGLRPQPLTRLEPATPVTDGIGLAPGDSAHSRLYWPGYRSAADQHTPQTLSVRSDPAMEPIPVSFLPTSNGDDPGPAPFDLKAGVEGGAVIEIGAWEAAPSSEG